MDYANGHPVRVDGPRAGLSGQRRDVDRAGRELKFRCPRDRFRIPAVGLEDRNGSLGAARDRERIVRCEELGAGRRDFHRGRVRAERHGASDWCGGERCGSRAGRRHLDEEDEGEREGHENTHDEKGRVAVPPIGSAGG